MFNDNSLSTKASLVSPERTAKRLPSPFLASWGKSVGRYAQHLRSRPSLRPPHRVTARVGFGVLNSLYEPKVGVIPFSTSFTPLQHQQDIVSAELCIVLSLTHGVMPSHCGHHSITVATYANAAMTLLKERIREIAGSVRMNMQQNGGSEIPNAPKPCEIRGDKRIWHEIRTIKRDGNNAPSKQAYYTHCAGVINFILHHGLMRMPLLLSIIRRNCLQLLQEYNTRSITSFHYVEETYADFILNQIYRFSQKRKTAGSTEAGMANSKTVGLSNHCYLPDAPQSRATTHKACLGTGILEFPSICARTRKATNNLSVVCSQVIHEVFNSLVGGRSLQYTHLREGCNGTI